MAELKFINTFVLLRTRKIKEYLKICFETLIKILYVNVIYIYKFLEIFFPSIFN
jgi:hypothetical protein